MDTRFGKKLSNKCIKTNVISFEQANDTRAMFIIGTSKSKEHDTKLKEESKRFNDILQADFIDDYYNLTLKSMFGMKYYLNYNWKVIDIFCYVHEIFLSFVDCREML